jgi:hypothetical protein
VVEPRRWRVWEGVLISHTIAITIAGKKTGVTMLFYPKSKKGREEGFMVQYLGPRPNH